MPPNIKKIYASNFLTGLVFWYGIEKLFMQNIGIDALGIGIASAFLLAFNLLFDIPSGILADRWSRKGVLFISAIAMAACSLTMGFSYGLSLYLVAYLFYGVRLVATSGTYQALVYDTLHEQNLASQYSKVMGRAFAIFLVGAGVANLASGFLAGAFDYRFVMFASIIPCFLNMVVIASIKEPSFHKAGQKERILRHFEQAFGAVIEATLLRGLAVIMTMFAIIELFKIDFGQMYMLRYVSEPELIGILWAAYAFTWALGSAIAHRLRTRLNVLIIATVLPLMIMSFLDSWVALILFMIQAVAAAALLNQIETRVQDVTPSAVRASILSVLSSLGRAVSIPASLGIGWIVYTYKVTWALYAVTFLGVLVLLYWLWLKRKVAQIDKPITARHP